MPMFSSFSRSRFMKRGPHATGRRKGPAIRPRYEALEPRHLLAAMPVINEFLSSNGSGLVNDNGNRSDWIEIYNAGDLTVNLQDYSLTDDPTNTSKFVFPNLNLLPGQYLVVYADDDANPNAGNDQYTGFSLSSSGEYVGLYDPSGTVVSEFAAGGGDYPTQLTDISYGFVDDGSFGQPSYFSVPTPGAANQSPVFGVVERVTSSVTPGFFDAPFPVALSTTTANATIRYTTDGSTPTATNGITYTGPITINGTTNLRAVATQFGYLSVPDRTWSYLFLDDVLQQNSNAPSSGWPSNDVNGQLIDYGIDPDVISLQGAQAVKDALLAIPTWSVTTDVDNLFDASTGIYVNANNDGIAWERPASLEQLNPDGSEGFQVNAGIRIRGGFSRNDNNPKHAFKFFFRSEYGDSSLEYDLFKDDPSATQSFEKIDLRTAQNYSWSFYGDPSNNFVADVLARENQASLGQQATRSHWVHLYLNGQYWGLFQSQERADANFGASYFGGDAEDYDVLKPERGPYQNIATDGNFAAYDALYQQALARGADGVTPAFADNAAYYKAQGLNPDGTNNPNYEPLLDVENLTAYMLVILQSGNFDAPISNFLQNNRINNYFAVRDRTGDEGFRFFVHDSEHSYRSNENRGLNRNGPYNHPNFESGVEYFNPQWLHQQLMANQEYRVQFADKVQEAFFNGGPMSVEAQIARVDGNAAEIDQAIIAESARWGDSKVSFPRLRSDWLNAVDDLRSFLNARNNVVVEQFRNTVLELKTNPGSSNYNNVVQAPLFPDLDAPEFAVNGTTQSGGEVAAGDSLTLAGNEGTVYYTTDGTDPREVGGSLNPSAIAYDASTTQTQIFDYGSVWNYYDLGVAADSGWQNENFDDSSWSAAATELGYGQPTTNNTVSFGPDASNKYITTYFRRTFNLPAGNYTGAAINLQLDDGAVVYLNGTEIGRDNLPSGPIGYGTFANGFVGGANETTPVPFEIPLSLLKVGVNTLAVEVHQANLTSSDLTFDAELIVEESTSPSGPITLGTSTNVKARVLSNGQWSALHDATFVIPALQSDLRISEIHFNPGDPSATEIASGFTDNDDFEFLELYNPSATGAINLSGAQLSNGVIYNFGNVDLLPRERVVVVEDADAFVARYGNSIRVLGEWSGALNNSGEQLTLIDSDQNEIMSVNFGDNDPWHHAADGHGFSLVLDNAASTPAKELGKYYSWRASTELGGTPGAASVDPSGVVINEVLAHTDAPQSDSIELYNPTASAIDIGGWYLSDEGNELQKYQIPVGSVIAAGGYLVFDESDFNVGATGFALSGSLGDQVYLSQGSGGSFVGLEDTVEFDATFNGQSLGRLPDGSGRLTRFGSNSFGSANGDAEVGPLVISEINYHPEDPNAAALALDASLIDNDLEYIEIANPTSGTVDLTNWRLRGESDYEFAAGTSLAAGAALIVVSFDPSALANTFKIAAFRAHYGLSPDVTIVGGFTGGLSNSSGRIALQQPDTPDSLGFVPRVVVDEVVYDDLSPWPSADGSGQVLERDALAASGSLASSWLAAAATPGGFESDFLLGDANQDGVVDFSDIPSFISLLQNGIFLDEADINGDGVVDFADIPFFIDLLSAL